LRKTMDVNLINPFINATVHVIKTTARIDVTAGKPFIKKDKIARGDVSGIIGLTGESSGTIAVSFSETSILYVVSRMFGEEMTRLNEEIGDAVGEIANMISGQARQALEEMGRPLKAAIPSVIIGRGHQIAHMTSRPVMAIPFHTEKGGFTIEVCFEK
jgi:chemotaxis protein CheX